MCGSRYRQALMVRKVSTDERGDRLWQCGKKSQCGVSSQGSEWQLAEDDHQLQSPTTEACSVGTPRTEEPQGQEATCTRQGMQTVKKLPCTAIDTGHLQSQEVQTLASPSLMPRRLPISIHDMEVTPHRRTDDFVAVMWQLDNWPAEHFCQDSKFKMDYYGRRAEAVVTGELTAEGKISLLICVLGKQRPLHEQPAESWWRELS